MNRYSITIILAMVFISFLGYKTKAADIYLDETADSINYLVYSGGTEEGDSDKLTEVLSNINNDLRTVLMLEGPGGIAGEIDLITDIIHENNIETTVIGSCYSACAAIWATGTTRYFQEGDVIGFHWGYTDTDVVDNIIRDYGIHGVRQWLIGYALYSEGTFLKMNPHINAADYLINLADTSPSEFWELDLSDAVNIFNATYLD